MTALGCNKIKTSPFRWVLNFFSSEENNATVETTGRDNDRDDSINKHSLLSTAEKNKKITIKEQRKDTTERNKTVERKDTAIRSKTVERKNTVEREKIAEKKDSTERKKIAKKKDSASIVKKTDKIITKKEIFATKKKTKIETEKNQSQDKKQSLDEKDISSNNKNIISKDKKIASREVQEDKASSEKGKKPNGFLDKPRVDAPEVK